MGIPHVKNDEDLNFVVEKGIYPYDYGYMGQVQRDRTSITRKIYSKLNEEDISYEDYERAKQIWDRF